MGACASKKFRVRDQFVSNGLELGGLKEEEIPAGLRTTLGYRRDLSRHYSMKTKESLGRGQFGTTFLAEKLSTREKFACKVLRKDKMKIPLEVEDVKREISILRLLSDHPNVVRLEDAFEDEEHVYIVMELCKGGELLEQIISKGDECYSEKDAAKIVRQLLSVVAKCHLHGVVHRDIKPENFLFKSKTKDSEIKLIDFGLSDYRRPGMFFSDIVGSAHYVAPEVLRRKSGPESDVWSVGVITYILLCGRYPFNAETQKNVFYNILSYPPNLHEQPWPSISESAKDFILKLLCKNPRLRYTAAQALSHRWVKEGGDASDLPLDISVLENVRSFEKSSRLRQVALRALVNTLDDSQITFLRDQFHSMDTNGDGKLTLKEIKDALLKDKPCFTKVGDAAKILKSIDLNNDGTVDFKEFMTAALHVRQMEATDEALWDENCKKAFGEFDANNDGYIDENEIRKALGIRGSIDLMLKEVDTDGDRRINFSEFKEMLRSSSKNSLDQ